MFSRGVEGVASLIGTGKMECQEIEKKMPILETAWDSGISVSWRSMELPLFGSCPAAFPPDLPCRSLQDAWDTDFEEILCQAVADGVGVSHLHQG